MNICNSGTGVEIANNFLNAVGSSSEMTMVITRLKTIHEKMESLEKGLMSVNAKLHGPMVNPPISDVKDDGNGGYIDTIHAVMSRIEVTLDSYTAEITALERL